MTYLEKLIKGGHYDYSICQICKIKWSLSDFLYDYGVRAKIRAIQSLDEYAPSAGAYEGYSTKVRWTAHEVITSSCSPSSVAYVAFSSPFANMLPPQVCGRWKISA